MWNNPQYTYPVHVPHRSRAIGAPRRLHTIGAPLRWHTPSTVQAHARALLCDKHTTTIYYVLQYCAPCIVSCLFWISFRPLRSFHFRAIPITPFLVISVVVPFLIPSTSHLFRHLGRIIVPFYFLGSSSSRLFLAVLVIVPFSCAIRYLFCSFSRLPPSFIVFDISRRIAFHSQTAVSESFHQKKASDQSGLFTRFFLRLTTEHILVSKIHLNNIINNIIHYYSACRGEHI